MLQAVLLLSFAAWGGTLERYLERDPKADLAQLRESGKIEVQADGKNGIYTAEASAVLGASAADLQRVATDFEGYPELGIPSIYETKIVKAPADEPEAWKGSLYTYNEICIQRIAKKLACRAAFSLSRHYARIRVHSAGSLPTEGASGTSWDLVEESVWEEDSAPKFKVLRGTWFVEPLDEKTSYVRYFLEADPIFPGSKLAKSTIVRRFAEGVREMIRAFEQAAIAREAP